MARRIAVILGAFLLASLAAAIVITISTMVAMIRYGGSSPLSVLVPIFFKLGGTTWLVVTGLTLLPSLITIAIGEYFRLRTVFFYLLSSVVVEFVSQSALRIFASMMAQWRSMPTFSISATMFIAAVAAGLVYWASAGRWAGLWRNPQPRANAGSPESAKVA